MVCTMRGIGRRRQSESDGERCWETYTVEPVATGRNKVAVVGDESYTPAAALG